MSVRGDAYTIHINSRKLARLLKARLIHNNKASEIKVPEFEILKFKKIIEDYFDICFKAAIDSGEAISIPFIGNLQVVKKISKKGYAWDKKYNGKDYELCAESNLHVDISVDKKYYEKIISRVDKGVEYEYEIINHAERLEEILSLLHDGPKGIKRTRNKIAA